MGNRMKAREEHDLLRNENGICRPYFGGQCEWCALDLEDAERGLIDGLTWAAGIMAVAALAALIATGWL